MVTTEWSTTSTVVAAASFILINFCHCEMCHLINFICAKGHATTQRGAVIITQQQERATEKIQNEYFVSKWKLRKFAELEMKWG